MQISKGIGIIARLTNLMSFSTLLINYRSLIEPHISYGLFAWGQAINKQLDKIVTLRQRRVLLLMYFMGCKSRSNSRNFRQLNYFTLNRLHLCMISALHPISQIYLLTLNKLIPRSAITGNFCLKIALLLKSLRLQTQLYAFIPLFGCPVIQASDRGRGSSESTCIEIIRSMLQLHDSRETSRNRSCFIQEEYLQTRWCLSNSATSSTKVEVYM